MSISGMGVQNKHWLWFLQRKEPSCQGMEVPMGGHREVLEPSTRGVLQLDVPVGIPLYACAV